jgi:site-specific recombinase XerD
MTDYPRLYIQEKMISKSPETISNYTQALGQFSSWLDRPVETTTKADIMSYLTYLLNDKKLARSSISTYLIQLQTFFKWMVNEKYMLEDPCKRVDKIKVDKKAPIYLTMDEMGNMFKVARHNNRDYLVVSMLYATGVRVSELVNIRKADIDFQRNNIKVFGKGAKERIVKIPDVFKDELITYTKGFGLDQLLFPLTPSTVEKDIRRIAGRAQISKKITPHKLRHTFATHMLQAGSNIVAIQKLMGHSSLSTTQIYMHYSDQELNEEYAKHPLANMVR